ncbi:MAG: flavodoxin family protein [Desulfobacterales bacterium]|nr:MAG: flavodoxin family protein [Desulfobacterales bacterium]
MQQVLALLGSPRKLGNSELIAKEISRHIPESHRLLLIRLPQMEIRPCRACYTCLFDTCPQQDDFLGILEALIESDALILVAPTYLLSANASVKKLVDRGLSFYPYFEQLWGKPAVAVAVAGIPGMEGFTKLCLESAVRLMGGQLKASEVVYGALPGEVFMNHENRQVAKTLARALFGPSPDLQEIPWRCPACGGDTFRFLSPDQVRCMTCSSPGKAQISEGRISFAVHPPEDHFFLTLEGARRHLDWLRGMKQRFLQKKKELKAICLDYRKEGKWLQGRMNEENRRVTGAESIKEDSP